MENICIAVQSSDDVAGWETGINFYLDNVSVTVDPGSGETPVASEDPSVTAPPAQEPDEDGRLYYYDFDGSPADTSEIFRGGMSLAEDGGNTRSSVEVTERTDTYSCRTM